MFLTLRKLGDHGRLYGALSHMHSATVIFVGGVPLPAGGRREPLGETLVYSLARAGIGRRFLFPRCWVNLMAPSVVCLSTWPLGRAKLASTWATLASRCCWEGAILRITLGNSVGKNRLVPNPGQEEGLFYLRTISLLHSSSSNALN